MCSDQDQGPTASLDKESSSASSDTSDSDPVGINEPSDDDDASSDVSELSEAIPNPPNNFAVPMPNGIYKPAIDVKELQKHVNR